MTRNQLIKIVNDRTENALVNQVDFQALLASAEQEFCAEHRYWWRKKRCTLSTISGTDTYDLSTATTTPSTAGLLCEEITYVGRVDGTQVQKLDPIFDDEAIATWSVDTAQDKPTLHTIETNTLTNSQSLRVHKVPNGVYTLHIFFWAMPNPVQDASDDTIYVTPPMWHHALQANLEKHVWRLKYGTQDPKFITAKNYYDGLAAKAKAQVGFNAEKHQTFKRNDGQAIRSTR